MRIVSSFRDYYDSVQSGGQDQSLQYIRETKDIEGYTVAPFPTYSEFWQRSAIKMKSVRIGFCGTMYAGLRIETPTEDVTHHTFYDAESAINFLLPRLDKHECRHFTDQKKDYFWRWGGDRRRGVEKYFELTAELKDRYTHVFEELKVPIFRIHRVKYDDIIVVNPLLRTYEFYKVFDCYSAFQEISMFLGGMAFPNRPIPHVSDKDLAACKGFDKFSFRKEKSK